MSKVNVQMIEPQTNGIRTIDTTVKHEFKKAKTSQDAWKIQEMYNGKPHGWVQWKGTEVCMDIHCKCGELFHVDEEAAYNVKCPFCKTVYMCNGHIELIELEVEPENCIISPTNP